jgi:membrane protease YdiL (CAAX protease family)
MIDRPVNEVPAEAIIVTQPADPTRERKPFPGFWGAVLLLLLLLGMQVVGGIAYGIVLAIAGGPTSAAGHPTAVALATAVINVASFVVVMATGLALARCPPREVLPFSAFRWSVLLPVVLAVEGIGILASESDNLLRSIFPMPEFIAELVSDLSRGGIASLIALVVIAPITEELLFRGLILRGFLARYRTSTAILVSSILFALVHVNPYQFCTAFLMGVFLAWLFLRTRSLWPCIIAHALFNLHPIVLPFAREILGLDIPGYTGSPDAGVVEFQPIWFNLLGLALVGIGIWAVGAVTRRRGPAVDAESP